MKCLSFFAALFAASLSLAVRAADIAVEDGVSFALDGADNVAANRLVFSDVGDATLTLTGAGDGETKLLAQVVSAGSGAITLALDAGTGKTLRLANHVSVKGSLAITGADAVTVGDTAVTPATLDAATSFVSAFPAFDVETLASAVTIDGAVQLAALPTTGADKITKATTAFLALTGKEALGAADAYTLDYDVMIAHTNAFKWGATINVENGHTLGYVPMTVASDYSWTRNAVTKHYMSFNVVLGAEVENASAQFHIWTGRGGDSKTAEQHTLTGVISGTGDVKFLPMMAKGSGSSAWVYFYFNGRQSFTGQLYSNNAYFYAYTGVPEDGVCPFTVRFTNIDNLYLYRGSMAYGSDNVTIPSFWSGYYNTTLNPYSGQTITIKELSGGGFNIVGAGASESHVKIENNKSASGNVLRSKGARLTLDADTLKYNHYYDIDNSVSSPRVWYRGNGSTSLANVSGQYQTVGVGVPVGQTFDITTLSANKLCVVEEGATVTIGTVATGASVQAADSATVTIGSQAANTTVTADDNAKVAVTTLGAGATVAIGAGASIDVTTLGGNNTISGAKNSSVTVRDANCDTLTLSLGRGSTTQFYDSRDAQDWTNNVTLWVDASKTETLHPYTNEAGVAQSQPYATYCGAPAGSKAQAWWYDWRANQTQYYLYNVRGYNNESKKEYPAYQQDLAKVYPFLHEQGGPGGKPCVSFGILSGNDDYVDEQGAQAKVAGTPARLEVHTFGGAEPSSSGKIEAAYVVMVYGADTNKYMLGGAGLFKEAASGDQYPMKRAVDAAHGTFETPMVADANTTVTVRKNGAAAESAATATFDEGWQILGLDTTGHAFGGIGYGSNYYGGGQKVAEVLVFETMPSETEKASIEAYLSQKWGISVTKPTLAPTVNGAGTIRASGCNLSLTNGTFAGTVDLADGAVTLRDGALVPTADDLPQQDKILAWFDPSETNTLALTQIPATTIAQYPGSEQTNEVAWVNDRRGATPNSLILGARNDRGHVYNDGNRRGFLVWRDHVTGVQRSWIDCNNYYTETDKDGKSTLFGNAYRFYNYSAECKLQTTDNPIEFATAFIVQDSEFGGGSPILDEFSGTGPYLRRTTSRTAALWKTGVSAALSNGAVYINGTQVANPMASAEFTGSQEVLTIQTQDGTTFPAKALGDYNDSENASRAATYGEVLFYSVQLSEAERKTVEAYLAWKWNSICQAGYMHYETITLDGSAAYTTATLAKLPQFAATYTGTVTLQQNAFTLAFDETGAVSDGSFAIPGTVILPAAVTVTLPETPHLRSNTTVKLFSWGNLGSQTTFTLDAPEKQVGSRDFVLRTENDGLYLDIRSKGLQLMFR